MPELVASFASHVTEAVTSFKPVKEKVEWIVEYERADKLKFSTVYFSPADDPPQRLSVECSLGKDRRVNYSWSNLGELTYQSYAEILVKGLVWDTNPYFENLHSWSDAQFVLPVDTEVCDLIAILETFGQGGHSNFAGSVSSGLGYQGKIEAWLEHNSSPGADDSICGATTGVTIQLCT